MAIRQPIVLLCGHVDHGKSSILEKIREISITSKEAGGITQTLKSYNLSLNQLKKMVGNLINKLGIDVTIPGILFLDSPGHAAFNNLRKRGGNLADIAILVIDIKEGVMPQTVESIEILKNYKTPFIIALNKIDSISGWSKRTDGLIKNINAQSQNVLEVVETKLYKIVEKLAELGLNSDRFDRIDDYTKQVAIVPCSAKSGEGIQELLMVLAGLSQRYLEQELKLETSGAAKGTILEIREEKGLGKILDVIIYDGTIKKGDNVLIGTLGEPINTKVKGLFLSEKGRLVPRKEIAAAEGVVISASELDNVISGMPLAVIRNNLDGIRKEIKQEIGEVLINTDIKGIIIKADTLGSLEALTQLLKERNIPIKKASLGDVTKADISEAKSEKDEKNRVILGFNVKNAKAQEVKVITNDVIYKIIEDYEGWLERLSRLQESRQLEDVTYPAKIQILRGCIFRQSNPAVVGVRIIGGILRNSVALIKEDGSKCSEVKSMQSDSENIQEAGRNKEVAISIPGVIVGRHIDEDTILYSDIKEEEFTKLKKLKKLLNRDDIEVLKEIAIIKRKNNPMWGV
ncbi:MAG: translation initiation factor IF-2 [Nanoarchaeota archaeon]